MTGVSGRRMVDDDAHRLLLFQSPELKGIHRLEGTEDETKTNMVACSTAQSYLPSKASAQYWNVARRNLYGEAIQRWADPLVVHGDTKVMEKHSHNGQQLTEQGCGLALAALTIDTSKDRPNRVGVVINHSLVFIHIKCKSLSWGYYTYTPRRQVQA